MNILGHGIDVVDVARFSRLLQDGREKHRDRYFTQRELAAISTGDTEAYRLATRFAAKEAVMKALGHGFGDGLGFTDIEIEISESGAPSPILHRKALSLAETMGIRHWWLSISHSGGVAVASAIACG